MSNSMSGHSASMWRDNYGTTNPWTTRTLVLDQAGAQGQGLAVQISYLGKYYRQRPSIAEIKLAFHLGYYFLDNQMKL